MSQIDDLPPLRTVIERHELAAKKNLGQNFLLDLNITMKIARQTGPLDGQTVVEIGPGPGGLTRALLANNARKVIAIERDERCIPVLEEIQAASGGRLQFCIGDALETNIDELVDQSSPGQPYKIIANLPYNVATPLFTNWLSGEQWPPRWSAMVLMFQKEVAERITATHHDKAWGRLGVLSSWRTQSKVAFDLAPQAFSPPPKVTSSVVVTTPHSVPLQATQRSLETVSKAAFGQRRKMLRQSLKALGGEALLNLADIVPTLRAEDLSLDEFVALARVLDDRT